MAYLVHSIQERGEPLERTVTAYAQLAYGATDPISPGHVRDLTGEERALLADGHYHIYARVLVENGAGEMVNYGDFGPGGRQWFCRARWSDGIDNPVASGECELWLEQDGLSLAPLVRASALNRGAGGEYAPALDAGRRIEIRTATVAPGTLPGEDAFHDALIGKVDAVDWTAREGRLSLAFRDLGAWLVDTHIRAERTYEDEEGLPLGELIQRILDDNPHRPGAPVPALHVMGDPDWYVRRHVQAKATSVFEAIRSLAQQIGWDVRYRWTEAGYQLTLYLPGRDRTTADLVLDPDEYLEVGEAKLGDANVRNDIDLEYRDADGEAHTVTHGNPVCQSRYGYRYMFIGEASTSTIDTDGEAMRMITAVAADLDTPEFTHAARLRYWWAVQLGDVVDFVANDVHYDQPQRLAVQAVEHVLENGGGYTTVQCSGRPRGAYQGWLGKGSGTGGDGFDATLTPVVDVRLLQSSPTHLVYEIRGTTAGGEEVWLYLAQGADVTPSTPIPNPYELTVARATADRQQQFYRIRARSESGREATAVVGADYDFVPGILFAPSAEPLFDAGEQVGWKQAIYLDDDARGLRVRLQGGDATFDSSEPAAQHVGGTDYWLDVQTLKSVSLHWTQDPGQDAFVEITPYERYGPSSVTGGDVSVEGVTAAAGASGVPMYVRLARAPVTVLTVSEQGPGLRRLVFTMSPPDGTLHYRIGDATLRQVREPVHAVNGVEVSSDVLVRWYGVSEGGVPEVPHTRLLDSDQALSPPVVNVHESPANTLTVSLGVDEEAMVWRVWARRGAWPVDAAGTPLPQYLVAEGNLTDTDFVFYAAGTGDASSRWYLVARVFDRHGALEETRLEKVVHGSTTAEGFLSGVRARLQDHGGGLWYNEVSWDFNDAIESDAAAEYRIDLVQNGVLIAQDLDPRVDPEGTLGQPRRGGHRVRMVGGTAGDPESTVRTFTYDVVLKKQSGGTVEATTNRISFSALYRGDGEYQPVPSAAPTPAALDYQSWSDSLAAVWVNAQAGYAAEIEYQATRYLYNDPFMQPYQLDWELENSIETTEVFRLQKGAATHRLSAPWDGWSYRFRVRHVANTGDGPWSWWSEPRLVQRPSGSTGGSGGGGAPPTELQHMV